MTVPKPHTIRAFLAATTLFCFDISATFAASVEMREKTRACSVGQFILYDANYHYDYGEVDEIVIMAIMENRKDGNTLREDICGNQKAANIREGYSNLILAKVDAANMCVRKQMQMGASGNFQALLAFVKYENSTLKDITNLVNFGVGSGEMADNINSGAERIYDSITNAKTVRNDANKLFNAAQKGDGATRHLLMKMFGEHYTDSAQEVFVQVTSPWDVAGELYKLYADAVVSGGASSTMSFSHSLCQ